MGEDRKALAKRFYAEIMPSGDADAAAALISDDFVNHATPPGAPEGPENVRFVVKMLADAFSDQSYDVHHVVTQDDIGMVHCTWKATHTGEFMGIPATGKSFAADQVHVFRFDSEDKVAEHWAVRDDLEMLRQLGIAPG